MFKETIRVWRQRKSINVASVGFVLLFFIAFFARVFIRGRFIITGDAFYEFYPLRTVAWAMIRGGQLPLWTPLILSGYPLLAIAQLGLGYPLSWLDLIVPGKRGYTLYHKINMR